MKEFAVYTAARLGMFIASYALVLGVYVLIAGTPVPVLWPLLVAAVLSAIVSAFALRGMRDRFTLKVQQRADLAARRNAAVREKEAEMRARDDHP